MYQLQRMSHLRNSANPLESASRQVVQTSAQVCVEIKQLAYVVYSSIGFADDASTLVLSPSEVECSDHGRGFATYICEHLLADPAQPWISNKPDEEEPWPDAWCASCEALFLEQGEWNEKNQPLRQIKMVCHHCYEKLRSQATES